MTVQDLAREYRQVEGRHLSVVEFGYSNLLDFLKRECTDILQVGLNLSPDTFVSISIHFRRLSAQERWNVVRHLSDYYERNRKFKCVDREAENTHRSLFEVSRPPFFLLPLSRDSTRIYY